MKQGWEVNGFEDCLEKIVYTNKVQRKDFLIIGKYPIISQEQDFINGYWDNSADLFTVKKPIIIFGDHTQVLKYVDFDFVLGADGVKILQPKSIIYPRFFYYFLQSINLGSLGYARHYRLLKEIEVHFPKSLPEQQRIVAILDEAFAAIAQAKANAEQNLRNAKELFESYLQSVFENKGEGWEEKTLGEIADVEYGYTDKSTGEGDFRYVRITDINRNGELISQDKKYIPYSKEAENFLIQDNDLLMARTGATFAKVLLYKDYEPSVFASYLIRIKFKVNVENELYWHFTKTKNYWVQANNLQSGAAQPHFNGAAVKQVMFSYPKSVELQQSLIQKFEALSAETKQLEANYQQKINDLDELKKSILQKAFAGELNTTALEV
jgi:type I restriction enzyme S subunit